MQIYRNFYCLVFEQSAPHSCAAKKFSSIVKIFPCVLEDREYDFPKNWQGASICHNEGTCKFIETSIVWFSNNLRRTVVRQKNSQVL